MKYALTAININLYIGKDYSVGILLSILIQYYTLEFELTTTDKPRGKLTCIFMFICI
jgi:hypothetical protein